MGSTLLHQLLPLELHFSVISNLEKEDAGRSTVHSQVNLPMTFIDLDSKCIPRNWGFIIYRQIMFFDTIRVGKADCTIIEQETVPQSKCDKWFEMRAK